MGAADPVKLKTRQAGEFLPVERDRIFDA